MNGDAVPEPLLKGLFVKSPLRIPKNFQTNVFFSEPVSVRRTATADGSAHLPHYLQLLPNLICMKVFAGGVGGAFFKRLPPHHLILLNQFHKSVHDPHAAEAEEGTEDDAAEDIGGVVDEEVHTGEGHEEGSHEGHDAPGFGMAEHEDGSGLEAD